MMSTKLQALARPTNVIVVGANGTDHPDEAQHFASGGSLLVLLSGTSSSNQLSAFLRKVVGITANKDTVVSLSHSTGASSLHPRHVRIVADGASHPDIIDAGVRSVLYTEGTTLRPARHCTAVPILSSGPEAFPTNLPLAVAWEDGSSGGRIVVVGSASLFSDAFLKKEDNGRLCNTIFQFLSKSNDRITFSPARGGGIPFDDDNPRPDIAALANRIKPSLGMLDPLPQDLTELYCDDNLFGFDTDTVVNDLYQALDVPRGALQLIQPEFESVMPPLQLAVFPPQIELPPPTLELFNLDEECADRHTKLGQIANECLNEGTSAEEFVQRAGTILGVGDVPTRSGKYVLSRLFAGLVQIDDQLPVLHVSAGPY